MRASLECIPCYTRQAVDLVKSVTDDLAEQERLLRKFLRAISEMDFDRSSPAVAQELHRLVQPFLPEPEEDPYLLAKEEFNRIALRAYPEARRRVRESPDPLTMALKLAAAGNILDLGVNRSLSAEDFHDALDRAIEGELIGDVEGFREAVDKAASILYIADNAGEIVFDKLLLELLPREKVTVAVRGKPVLNDATIEDAEKVGVTDLVEVIDTGSDAPGILLEDCHHDFRQYFSDSDMVIAKGQGNFETLTGGTREVFFLLKVKCEVVGRELRNRIGDLVLHRWVPAEQPDHGSC